MKSLVKRISVLLMLLITVTVGANPTFDDIRVSMLKTKTINLQFSNTDGDLNLSIKDIEGNVLYNEEFKGPVFSKRFNLDLLSEGEYMIEISGNTKISSIPLKIEDSKVEVLESSEVIIYKPIVRVVDNMVIISKISYLNEKVTIELFENDIKLYGSRPIYKTSIYKGLDISNLPQGEYSLVINYADRIHKTIIKK